MIVQANSAYMPLEDESIHCCVTSPPYWALRSYLADDDPLKPYEIGLEPTLDEFIHKMVLVFREVWRVLRPDGTCWVNLGDSFSTASNGRSAAATKATGNDDRTFRDKPFSTVGNGLKAKDLCMVPARVALALQADGWYLRSEIVWAKPNPMPESVTDRPTKAHEMVYLLTKRERYYYDSEAVRMPATESGIKRQIYGHNNAWGDTRLADPRDKRTNGKRYEADAVDLTAGRNLRSVWTIATEPYPAAHYATFPTKLVEPCILAGTSARGCCPKCGTGWVRVVEVDYQRMGDIKPNEKAWNPLQGNNKATRVHGRATKLVDTTGWRPSCSCGCAETVPAVVLDPFCGSGTTGYVAHQLGRRFVGLDLSPIYLAENALPRAEGKTSQKAIDQLPLFKKEAVQ